MTTVSVDQENVETHSKEPESNGIAIKQKYITRSKSATSECDTPAPRSQKSRRKSDLLEYKTKELYDKTHLYQDNYPHHHRKTKF